MPLLLAPYPTAAEAKRKKRPKRYPEGRIKYDWMAARAMSRYAQHRPALVSVDTETTGLGYYDEAFCVTLSWRRPSKFVIKSGVTVENHYLELADETGYAVAGAILADAPVLVFHNAKFDIQKCVLAGVLERARLTPDVIHDTWGQAHLLDTTQVCKLKVLAQVYLGESTNEAKQIALLKRRLKLTKEDGYDRIPRQFLIPYALKDTEYTLRLHELFYPRVQAYPDTMLRKYQDSMEEILVLLDIEARGYGIDLEFTGAKLREYGGRMLELEREIAGIVGRPVSDDGHGFNPYSVDQLCEYFGLTKGPGATDESALSKLPGRLPAAILELRGVRKIRNTYLKAIQAEQRDGVLHPNFNPFAAKTGRMSSSAEKGS